MVQRELLGARAIIQFVFKSNKELRHRVGAREQRAERAPRRLRVYLMPLDESAWVTTTGDRDAGTMDLATLRCERKRFNPTGTPVVQCSTVVSRQGCPITKRHQEKGRKRESATKPWVCATAS